MSLTADDQDPGYREAYRTPHIQQTMPHKKRSTGRLYSIEHSGIGHWLNNRFTVASMTDRPTLKTFKQGLVKGLGFGAGISIALATTTLLAAAAAMKVFSAGEVISATELNRNFTMAAPERAVMAFDLADCPDGWTIADGTNGAPDLRGRFIRGLDNMGIGAAGVDPDSATRTLGHEQMDAFQGHMLEINGAGYDQGGGGYGTRIAQNNQATPDTIATSTGQTFVTDGKSGDPRTSSETRPRNIALIHCMRKN